MQWCWPAARLNWIQTLGMVPRVKTLGLAGLSWAETISEETDSSLAVAAGSQRKKLGGSRRAAERELGRLEASIHHSVHNIVL